MEKVLARLTIIVSRWMDLSQYENILEIMELILIDLKIPVSWMLVYNKTKDFGFKNFIEFISTFLKVIIAKAISLDR